MLYAWLVNFKYNWRLCMASKYLWIAKFRIYKIPTVGNSFMKRSLRRRRHGEITDTNKWSEKSDMSPHRRRARIALSSSPGGVDVWLHLINGSLGPDDDQRQTASQSVRLYLACTQVWPPNRHRQRVLQHFVKYAVCVVRWHAPPCWH